MTKRKHEEEFGIKPLDTILAVAMGLIIIVNGIIGLFVKKGESPYILGKGFNVAFWIAFGIAVVNLVIRYFARGSAVKKGLMVIDLILMAVEVGIGFFVLQTVVDYFKNGSSAKIEAFLADTKAADTKLMVYLIVAAVALLLFMILMWAEKSTRKTHTMNVLIIIGAYLVLLVIDYWYVIVVLLIIVAAIAVLVGLIMLGVKTSRPRSSKSSSSGSSSSRSSYSSSSYSSSRSSSSSSSSRSGIRPTAVMSVSHESVVRSFVMRFSTITDSRWRSPQMLTIVEFRITGRWCASIQRLWFFTIPPG